MILILGTLGVEKETLAALGGLGNIRMGNIRRLLIAEIVGKMSVVQRRLAQPEVLFGKDQTPNSKLVSVGQRRTDSRVSLLETGTLVVQNAFIDCF